VERVWLWEYRWPEVENYLKEKDLILIPTGSTEQHGRHLPLGTDALVGIRLAEDVARKTNVLVAPPVWYGFTPQHMGFPGTVTISANTLIDLVTEIGQSLIYHGFKKLIIINGHRVANLPPLQISAAKLRAASGAYVAIVDPIYIAELCIRELLSSPDSGGFAHAGGLETAHMLHLYSSLVEKSEIPAPNLESGYPFHISDPFKSTDRVMFRTTFQESHPPASGNRGNPGWGSAERGSIMHNAMVDNFTKYVNDVLGFSVSSSKGTIPV
jgi:creatinine amidohydrolase